MRRIAEPWRSAVYVLSIGSEGIAAKLVGKGRTVPIRGRKSKIGFKTDFAVYVNLCAVFAAPVVP